MRESEFNLRHLIAIVAIVAAVLVAPIRLHAQSSAVTHIQSYYQQLMPTIQQAGRLSVRERDKRFTPAISSAFDLPTMTRLAVGPAWQSFSPAQQAAVRDAFAKFIIADYASQIKDYSGESFVVDPTFGAGAARRWRNCENQAVAARRPHCEYQLPGSGRAGDRRLSQRDYQRPRDATRRICLDYRLGRCRRFDQEVA